MNIAYVGPFAFPASSANSLRVKGVAEALTMGGHRVMVCPGMNASEVDRNAPLPNGIQVRSVPEYETGLLSGVSQGIRGLFLGDITRDFLASLEFRPDVIVLYGTHLGYLARLIPFCKKERIPLLLDVVEWYDPRHLPGGVLGPFAISNELSMRHYAKRADGMFVISRYLQEYFERKGCRTLRVPPIFSIESQRERVFRKENGKLNLCYVGSPGRKEDMDSIFLGLQRARDRGCDFQLHMIGVTAEEFSRDFGMDSLPILEDQSSVRFYGRLKNAEARRQLEACDFLLLIRKNRRFTQAGFPSKAAESLCSGVPLIANLSSNLGDYLVDEKNAIIVDDATADAVEHAVLRAAALSEEQLSRLRQCATLSAEQNFRVKANFNRITEFVTSFRG